MNSAELGPRQGLPLNEASELHKGPCVRRPRRGGRGTRPGAARETPDPPSPPRTPELGQAPGLPGGRSPDPWPWGAVDGGRGAYTGVGADPSS